MQTTIIHSELHVWFPFIFSMENEHHLVAPVGDKVVETQVAQRYNIGNVIFTEPHIVVVDIPCCLVGHCYRAIIDLKSHFRF